MPLVAMSPFHASLRCWWWTVCCGAEVIRRDRILATDLGCDVYRLTIAKKRIGEANRIAFHRTGSQRGDGKLRHARGRGDCDGHIAERGCALVLNVYLHLCRRARNGRCDEV